MTLQRSLDVARVKMRNLKDILTGHARRKPGSCRDVQGLPAAAGNCTIDPVLPLCPLLPVCCSLLCILVGYHTLVLASAAEW